MLVFSVVMLVLVLVALVWYIINEYFKGKQAVAVELLRRRLEEDQRIAQRKRERIAQMDAAGLPQGHWATLSEAQKYLCEVMDIVDHTKEEPHVDLRGR